MSRGRLFDQVADLYDDVRPDYPDDVYDVLAQVSGGLEGTHVLDLAAGPGLATRALVARGAAVTAVDVGAQMLRRLRRRTPQLPVAVAAAEQLPFRPSVFDLVTCATAWHWLDTTRTVDEVRRVVRPGGHLALWWANHRHGEGVDWEDAQSAVFERWDVERGSRAPDGRGVGPRDAAADLCRRGFDVVVEEELHWQRTVSVEQHLLVLRTHSDNLVLADRIDALIEDVAAALRPWSRVTERLSGPFVVARVT